MDEALYHLEHLLFERERRASEDAERAYEEAQASAEAAGAAAAPAPKPRFPAARAVCERLVRDFPASSFAEDALYDLAYMRFEEGDRAEGSALFERLVRTNPRSRYAAEAHFRIAEYAFDTNRFADAEKHDLLVLSRGITQFTDKALFKLGWIYHDLGRPDDAKRVLSDLLARQVRERERRGREYAPTPVLFFPGPHRSISHKKRDTAGDDLYEETLETIARVYAEAGGLGALLQFVKAQAKDGEPPRYAAPLLHRLALVHKEHSELAAAGDAYQRLLDEFPNFRGAPRAATELAELLAEQRDFDAAARVRQEMAERYAAGSAWARANPEEEYRHAALRTARNGLAASIRDFHARGLELQKEHGGVPDDLRRAIALYEQYLGRFPDGEKSYEARFRYAQALFAVGDYMKAAEAFRIVASDKQFDANREAAAYSRILSVTKLAGEGDHVPPAFVEPLVTAYEDYVALNPQGDKSAEILFKEGDTYVRADRDTQAIGAFDRLVRSYPEHRLASEASDSLARAQFRVGDFPAAERSSEKALAAAGPGGTLAARRAEIENLSALAIFKQGEKAEEETRFAEAAGHYLRLVERMPTSPVAVRALYNAAVTTERAGDRPAAAALFEKLPARYPDSDLAPDAAVRLAELAKDAPGGVDRILHVYEDVADHRVASAKGEELLFVAGKLAVKEQRSADAARLFTKLLARYPSTASDERGQRNLEVHYHLGVAEAEIGRPAAARSELELFLSRAVTSKAVFSGDAGAHALAVARANLILGGLAAEEFQAAHIVPPVAESLRRKQRLLDELLARYTPAMTSGLSPVATQASYAIGQAYEQFAYALRDAPQPSGLSSEERAEYGRLLEEKTRPYVRKAVDAYRSVVRASRASGLADDWVARCRERLEAVASSAFPREPRPGYLHIAAAGAVVDPPPVLPAAPSREELLALIPVLQKSPAQLVDLGILATERGAADIATNAFAAAHAGVASTDNPTLAAVLNDQALAALAAGDVAAADSFATASRQAAPGSAAAWNTAGMIEMRKKKFEAAENDFRAAVAADPTLGAAWANLGIVQELYLGTLGDAMESYRRYLATRPSDEQLVAGWIRDIEWATGGTTAALDTNDRRGGRRS